MQRTPIWSVSAWGGFICVLLAVGSLMHGYVTAGLVMLLGTVLLAGWALWLAHRRH